MEYFILLFSTFQFSTKYLEKTNSVSKNKQTEPKKTAYLFRCEKNGEKIMKKIYYQSNNSFPHNKNN